MSRRAQVLGASFATCLVVITACTTSRAVPPPEPSPTREVTTSTPVRVSASPPPVTLPDCLNLLYDVSDLVSLDPPAPLGGQQVTIRGERIPAGEYDLSSSWSITPIDRIVVGSSGAVERTVAMPYAAYERGECVRMVLTDHTKAGTFRTRPFRLVGPVVQPAPCASLDNRAPQPLGGDLPYGRAEIKGRMLEISSVPSWDHSAQPARSTPFELVLHMLWDEQQDTLSVDATGEVKDRGEFHLIAELPPHSRFAGRCVSALVATGGEGIMSLEFDYP